MAYGESPGAAPIVHTAQHLYSFKRLLLVLPTALAWELMQSPPSVRSSVCPFPLLTFEPSDL